MLAREMAVRGMQRGRAARGRGPPPTPRTLLAAANCGLVFTVFEGGARTTLELVRWAPRHPDVEPWAGVELEGAGRLLWAPSERQAAAAGARSRARASEVKALSCCCRGSGRELETPRASGLPSGATRSERRLLHRGREQRLLPSGGRCPRAKRGRLLLIGREAKSWRGQLRGPRGAERRRLGGRLLPEGCPAGAAPAIAAAARLGAEGVSGARRGSG